MSNLHIDSVLSQIRSMSAQVQSQAGIAAPGIGASMVSPAEAQSSPFATMMKKGIEQVNQAQASAGAMATAFERGTPGVELVDVMLESQKANVSFRALTEVRNRFVSVYQDIMNMPI
jgi:flagellar hook-basal body complex protein FliE